MKQSPRRPSPFRTFAATVRKQGPNYCIDVPMNVSRAFAPWGRAQRIA